MFGCLPHRRHSQQPAELIPFEPAAIIAGQCGINPMSAVCLSDLACSNSQMCQSAELNNEASGRVHARMAACMACTIPASCVELNWADKDSAKVSAATLVQLTEVCRHSGCQAHEHKRILLQAP